MSGLNLSEGHLGHLYQYSTCRLVRTGYCTQLKIWRHNYYYRADVATTRVGYCTRVMLTDYRTDDTRATAHVRHATTDRHARAPYTWARPPTCTSCRPPCQEHVRAPVIILQGVCVSTLIWVCCLMKTGNHIASLLPSGRWSCGNSSKISVSL